MAADELARGIMLHAGDCLDVLAELPADHFDSCVCDPPYHLVSIVNRFGKSQMESGETQPPNRGAQYKRLSAGFMGKTWDGGDVAADPRTWAAVLRVLKPGAHLVAFGGTRTYHRMACAIEDAGFELRDQIAWIYGQGFPKSHDVSKGIDRELGAERVNGAPRPPIGMNKIRVEMGYRPNEVAQSYDSEPTTEAAAQWAGWGTALKPALEPICLARKPLSEKTVAANVLKWGTGAINVDGCRVGTSKRVPTSAPADRVGQVAKGDERGRTMETSGFDPNIGRWPANLVHDGSDEAIAAFPDVGKSPPIGSMGGGSNSHSIYGEFAGERHANGFGDSGSAARFFYTAQITDEDRQWHRAQDCAKRFHYTSKADIDDRLGSRHPTVKPLDLMQWLVRLVTPPGGLVLDPFAGTGTTGEAAWREGFRAVLIEREPEYCADIRRRLELLLASSAERRRQAHKEKQKTRPLDHRGTLFE